MFSEIFSDSLLIEEKRVDDSASPWIDFCLDGFFSYLELVYRIFCCAFLNSSSGVLFHEMIISSAVIFDDTSCKVIIVGIEPDAIFTCGF